MTQTKLLLTSILKPQEIVSVCELTDRDDWRFFDTNCISYLAKSWEDKREKVALFLKDRPIILTPSIIFELQRAPDILPVLDRMSECVELYITSNQTFWYTDIARFINSKIPGEVELPKVYLVPEGYFSNIIQIENTKEAHLRAEIDILDSFNDLKGTDFSIDNGEHKFGAAIFDVVNRYTREWFDLELHPLHCSAEHFPSFYAYLYAQYYRYVRNGSNPELNDVVDLANCMVLPYCSEYYCERSFGYMLSKQIKGVVPPSPYHITKHLHKLGRVSDPDFRDIVRRRDEFRRSSALLSDTQIITHRKLRDNIETLDVN